MITTCIFPKPENKQISRDFSNGKEDHCHRRRRGGHARRRFLPPAAGARVTLLERNEKLGKKLYITGKGRCNLTNACEKEEFHASGAAQPPVSVRLPGACWTISA